MDTNDKRVEYAVLNTQILRPPRQSLATFGITNVYYYLVTEPAYAEVIPGASETVIREGRIIAERPDFHPAHNLLGIVHQRKGDYEKARDCLCAAIEVKEDYAEAHNNLGIVYKEIGQNDQAVTEFQRALSLGVERADVHYNLGNVYKQIGQYPTAVAELRKAIQEDSSFAPAYNSLTTVIASLMPPAAFTPISGPTDSLISRGVSL